MPLEKEDSDELTGQWKCDGLLRGGAQMDVKPHMKILGLVANSMAWG